MFFSNINDYSTGSPPLRRQTLRSERAQLGRRIKELNQKLSDIEIERVLQLDFENSLSSFNHYNPVERDRQYAILLRDQENLSQIERDTRDSLQRNLTRMRDLEDRETGYRSQRGEEEYWNQRRDEARRGEEARHRNGRERPMREPAVRFSPSTRGGSSEDEGLSEEEFRGRSTAVRSQNHRPRSRSRSISRVSIRRSRSPTPHPDFTNRTTTQDALRHDPEVFAHLPHSVLQLLKERYGLDLAGLMGLSSNRRADVLAEWPHITALAIERLAAARDLPVPRRFPGEKLPGKSSLRARRSFEDSSEFFNQREEGSPHFHTPSRRRSFREMWRQTSASPTLPSIQIQDEEQRRSNESAKFAYENIAAWQHIDEDYSQQLQTPLSPVAYTYRPRFGLAQQGFATPGMASSVHPPNHFPNGPWVPPVQMARQNQASLMANTHRWPANFGLGDFRTDQELAEMTQRMDLSHERNRMVGMRGPSGWPIERRGGQLVYARPHQHDRSRRTVRMSSGMRVLHGTNF